MNSAISMRCDTQLCQTAMGTQDVDRSRFEQYRREDLR